MPVCLPTNQNGLVSYLYITQFRTRFSLLRVGDRIAPLGKKKQLHVTEDLPHEEVACESRDPLRWEVRSRALGLQVSLSASLIRSQSSPLGPDFESCSHHPGQVNPILRQTTYSCLPSQPSVRVTTQVITNMSRWFFLSCQSELALVPFSYMHYLLYTMVHSVGPGLYPSWPSICTLAIDES